MFMTDDQKKYYAAMKKMGNKKPVKATPRPRVIKHRYPARGAHTTTFLLEVTRSMINTGRLIPDDFEV